MKAEIGNLGPSIVNCGSGTSKTKVTKADYNLLCVVVLRTRYPKDSGRSARSPAALPRKRLTITGSHHLCQVIHMLSAGGIYCNCTQSPWHRHRQRQRHIASTNRWWHEPVYPFWRSIILRSASHPTTLHYVLTHSKTCARGTWGRPESWWRMRCSSNSSQIHQAQNWVSSAAGDVAHRFNRA